MAPDTQTEAHSMSETETQSRKDRNMSAVLFAGDAAAEPAD